MAYSNPPNQTTANGINIGTRAEILPSAPLPDCNGVGGPAFAARIKNDATSDLMAILCTSGLPPRIDLATSMRSVDNRAILRLIDSGVVLWPQDDTRYYAFAFQRPLAPRMMQTVDEKFPVMSEDAINHHFVTPMIGALAELARTGVVHNAIRPSNIFWRIGSATVPQLGECLSAPAGFGQPVMFETMERAMSMPLGRGTGAHVDDCYAFGVTLAFLVLGQNPMQGMDDTAIIQQKIDRGSFAALINNRRLSASHVELLRGLLNDDVQQRWTSGDLELWLNGRRLTPKNTDSGRRATRHIEFGGKEYWQVRPLAAALATRVSDATQLIENGVLDKWLRRALGDDARSSALESAKKSLKESGKTTNYEEQLVARACIALDPPGPIRYLGLALMPGGIANMLVDALITGNNIQALSEIISSQLVAFWVAAQDEGQLEAISVGQQYERVRANAEKSGLGYGLERVVYELNPGLPCISPMLRSHYVITPKALLPALERLANSANRSREPMDRHIAAFLVVRDRRSESLFEAMTSSESQPKRGLSFLKLYAEMQQRHGPDALPNLAQWLLPILEPSIQRYLGHGLKEKLQAQVREVAVRGDLGALLRLIDDPRRIEYDRQEFMAARMLYLNTLKEIAVIENKLANRDIVINSTGKPMAAALSSFLAIILVMAAIIRVVWQNLMM